MTRTENTTRSNSHDATGRRMTAKCQVRMPEDERPDGDTSEYIPWDFDNDTYGESEVADLLDDGDEE